MADNASALSLDDQLRTAERRVTYWEAAADLACDDFVAAPIDDCDQERDLLALAEHQLEAALNRLERARAEAGGRRWLWLVEVRRG